MSDSPQGSDRYQADTKRLYATDDAKVWAEEWCKTATSIEAEGAGGSVIDEGWMIGWFANAMETAKSLAMRRMEIAVHRNDDGTLSFVTEPLPSEVLISAQLLEEMVFRHNECQTTHIRLL